MLMTLAVIPFFSLVKLISSAPIAAINQIYPKTYILTRQKSCFHWIFDDRSLKDILSSINDDIVGFRLDSDSVVAQLVAENPKICRISSITDRSTSSENATSRK